mmetsp:Transcript_29491/g.51787  ORF Transcript_29491/g.51787 Transcript_29491/m.51787 type:complete len:242 (-) Transcript_29491:2006-2731(-)
MSTLQTSLGVEASSKPLKSSSAATPHACSTRQSSAVTVLLSSETTEKNSKLSTRETSRKPFFAALTKTARTSKWDSLRCFLRGSRRSFSKSLCERAAPTGRFRPNSSRKSKNISSANACSASGRSCARTAAGWFACGVCGPRPNGPAGAVLWWWSRRLCTGRWSGPSPESPQETSSEPCRRPWPWRGSNGCASRCYSCRGTSASERRGRLSSRKSKRESRPSTTPRTPWRPTRWRGWAPTK